MYLLTNSFTYLSMNVSLKSPVGTWNKCMYVCIVGTIHFHHKHCIVPTICPWVSEDEDSLQFIRLLRVVFSSEEVITTRRLLCTKEMHAVRNLSVWYKIPAWFQNTVCPKTKFNFLTIPNDSNEAHLPTPRYGQYLTQINFLIPSPYACRGRTACSVPNQQLPLVHGGAGH